MNKIKSLRTLETNVDLGLLILRFSVASMMLLHGISKLSNSIGVIEGLVTESGLPQFFAYGVYIGEILAPLLIILGWATRGAALVLFINCVVALVMVHIGDIFSLNATGGWAVELLGLYMFGSLALIFTGGGKYALSNKYIWD